MWEGYNLYHTVKTARLATNNSGLITPIKKFLPDLGENKMGSLDACSLAIYGRPA